MNPHFGQNIPLARRTFLGRLGLGLGTAALAGLEPVHAATVADPMAPKIPHFAPKAKRVIHLFMTGAPSQLELFDPKPVLTAMEGKPLPASVIKGQRYAFIRPDAAVMGPRFKFQKYGQSGAEISEILPHTASIADELCIIRSMKTEQFNHAPAQLFFQTGFSQPGRPCIGSWALYGLGCETKNLPAFMVLSTGAGISGGSALWSSGFMPSVYSGTRLRNSGDPILHVGNPPGVDAKLQRETLDLAVRLNQRSLALDGDPETASRIAAYEMAFRLQTSAPELLDFSDETKATIEEYGCDPKQPSFARGCLMARRMIERGVRMVTIYNEGWDAHSDVVGNHRGNALKTDRACAALIRDLKSRGLLEDTLVIWGGEFGRTPMVESNPSLGRTQGRDHHPQAFTMWMAGGGIKSGMTYGATDELGFHVVEKPVEIYDLQATILHLLGFNHERLTFAHAGRDFRLTDVHGHVIRDILA
ncbi:MAG: DUF1501 domain-containing protein [Planctomycetota bacterium]|nr:DUF1501 domain-containing protein [Planctomycetota bacterium]